MKLLALLRARGVTDFLLFLGLAAGTGLLEALLEIAVIWAVVRPGEGPSAAIGFGGFLLLLGLLILARWATQARITGWFSGVVTSIRGSLLQRIFRIEPAAWERVTKDAVRQALSVLPFQLNSVAGNLAGAFLFSINALLLTLYTLSVYWPVGVVVLFSYTAVGAYLTHLSSEIGEHDLAARRNDATLRAGLYDLAHGRKELLLDPGKGGLLFADAIEGSVLRRAAARAPVRDLLLRYTMVYESVETVLGLIAALVVALVPHAKGDPGPLITLMIVYVVPYSMFRVATQVMSGEAAATQLEEIEARLDAAAKEARALPVEAAMRAPAEVFESLALSDVTYSYADRSSRFRAGPLNLRIAKGTTTFITGENGGGKSTLVKLLLGVYTPRSGACLLNGQHVDMRQHRACFAFVAANHVLFDQFYGYTTLDPARVNALLDEYGVGKVTRFENGRFSRVDLSSGQKKRVGLAVAVLEDKPVLVLDEWAAEQDRPMRERFYRDILPALRDAGRTIIAVTHDERYFDACDQLVMVRDGNIRYAGAPQDAPLHHIAHTT